ncbi:Uridine nucleosidase [Golovinomyces cichoracearum]|uniref:Uridine nucleosidase n=1 Tax=Golovinomyces cichoracearum TaxID=62708 RepID=A0A420IX02_9PEZI|nr:Uridine nucleosidase [Golovinomyces cichoracearum]
MGSKPVANIPDGKIPIWLDCDPGHDDAFALLLISHHPRLHALGASTVYGNSSLNHTTCNTLSLLTAFRSTHISVHPGAANPLCRPSISAPDIHGVSGIDGTSLLPKSVTHASKVSAVPAMARAIFDTPSGSAWIIATGALTNIAHLLRAYPKVATWVAGVSIMGGAVGDSFTSAKMGHVDKIDQIGNISRWAEFNILADPEAAQEVLSCSLLQGKIILIPLDVTHLVIATEDVRQSLLWGKCSREKMNGNERIIKKPNHLRQMMFELLNFFADTYAESFGFTSGPPLHDPVAVAVLLSDEISFTYKFHDKSSKPVEEQFEVTVMTNGSFADAKAGSHTGRTLVKLLQPGELGVRIPRDLDIEAFWSTVENCLTRALESCEFIQSQI